MKIKAILYASAAIMVLSFGVAHAGEDGEPYELEDGDGASTSAAIEAQLSGRLQHLRAVDENVLNIQERLAMIGYYPTYLVNGKHHPLMTEAITNFQKDYGLKIDGIFGTETATVLNYYTGTMHVMPISHYQSVYYYAAPGFYANF